MFDKWVLIPLIWFLMGLFRSVWKTGHWSWDTMDNHALLVSLLFMAVAIFMLLTLVYLKLKNLRKE